MSIVRYGSSFKGLRQIAKNVLSSLYPLIKLIYRFPKVRSIDDTLELIIKNKASISRYGDSEFLFIIDRMSLPYQVYDSELGMRMKEILVSNEPNHLVGLPIGYQTLDNLIPESKIFWRSQIVWVYPRLKKYLNLDKEYFNASMTRVYVTFDNKMDCGRHFRTLMKIWEGREVLIVEGEKSRLGVGNDLFERAISVQRILAPMHHAFSKYKAIYEEVVSHNNSKLILIALGPTATVLAYDLARVGFQAIDIGNVDIEYEWFLRGATTKVKIPGKYTSEAIGGRIVEDVQDRKYQREIIKRIL